MIKKLVFLTSILIVSVLFSCNRKTEIAKNPIKNVVVIIADDHALKVTGSYGNEIIHTPNIDRLAEEGVLFTHAYCNAPICSASRQSILTGKYPFSTGVNLLFTPFPDEGNITIAEHLRERGYKTALVGKTHFNNWAWSSLYKDGLPNHGFDTMIEGAQYRQFFEQNPQPELPGNMEFYNRGEISRDDVPEWMNSRNLPHAVYDEFSSGTFYARQAAEFIKENRENPFFLWMAFFEPHHPYYYPVEYTGKYNPNEMPLPEGSPEDDRWIPAKFRNLTDDQKRGIIAAYYTCTEYMDKNIGLVLNAIKDNGLDENTLVLYLSDNGYLLNDHKRFEKHTMWEEAIRQPMIIKAGNLFESGARKEALVEYIDVAPAILDILGEEPIDEAQGESFLPVLKNEAEEHRNFAFSTYLEDNLAMVCTKKWKYMFTTGSRDLGIGYATGYGPSGMVHRLYDLENDPQESHDVSVNYSEVMKQMQEQMLLRFMETHPDAKNCPEKLTLEGKLVWFCEPRDVGADQSLVDEPVRVFKK
jgi:arylsulfatase A-like enzyme